MLLELILAIALGILAGTITGLIPGIHINLIAILLLGFSASLLQLVSPITLAIFITAMAITHTFVDFIPSILLGAPDEDSILSILTGHRLLLEGYGYVGIIFTLYGSLIALLIILILSPIFIYLLPIVYPSLQKIMWIVLILVSCYLIFFIEKSGQRLRALIIFALAGFLGTCVLNLDLKEPLLPLLTGLFGASNLVISLKQKTKIPKQKILELKKIKLNKNSLIKTTFASIIAAPFTAFLPGLGASQAALIGKEVAGDLNSKEFLFLLGAINTIVMGLSFIILYSIQRTRTGAVVAISQILFNINSHILIVIIISMILSGIIAFFVTIYIAKLISKKIHKIKYSKISIAILSILAILTIYFTGILGFFVFIASTFLGIFTISIGVRKMHLMGCLLVPTILLYLI